jgi:type I restriction enzyme S subunit
MKKWIKTTLQDVCVETSQRDPRNTPNEYFTYIDIASINRDDKRIEEYKTIIGSESPSRARKEIRVNDVIVSTVRPNLNAVAIISEELNEQIASTGFCILRPNQEKLLPRYLFYFVCTNYFIDYLVSRASGASYPSVTDAVVKSAPIYLPPLFEQERIVRLLDEVESLRATRERANVRMDQFVPALFQELFDTASNEIISNSNNNWKEMKLGDVCSFTRGPFGGSLKKNVFKSDGYAVYEQRHAIHKDYSEIRYFINEEKFKEMARFELHPGELIMSCSGVTLGRVSIAPENMKPGIINQALLKLTPSNKKISVEFLKLWMESESFQVSIRKYSQGAAIPNIASVKILKDIPIYLPPLALQREFAARVEEARGVQSAQGKSTERVEALYQSMLSKAFAGEL